MNATGNYQPGQLEKLVGVSEAMNRIRILARQVAGTRISVLIQGESGTGKDIVARMIHDLSPRRDEPFVPVNCGAIPEGLFESEMFGHERGSFTGADRQHKGYFERADKGTLFLDEIGEMPPSMQVKVLRALESGEFLRVGGKQHVKVDVRVIAATNRDLFEEVQRGHFREDLYYRLRAVEIYLPPLRERQEDIPHLVNRFANEFSLANRISKPRILPDAMELIQSQTWPGNVRELKHFIGTLLTLENEGPIDSKAVMRHLPRRLHAADSSANLPVVAPVPREHLDTGLLLQLILDVRKEVHDIKEMLGRLLLVTRLPQALPEHTSYTEEEQEQYHATLEELERQQIEQVLRDSGGNRRKAAAALGISERTLYRKIKDYGIR